MRLDAIVGERRRRGSRAEARLDVVVREGGEGGVEGVWAVGAKRGDCGLEELASDGGLLELASTPATPPLEPRWPKDVYRCSSPKSQPEP